MQIIVLGMHRSGTSAVTRILNMMGAYFGPEGISTGANKENPKGFWERNDIRKLNDDLLFSINCDWHKIFDYMVKNVPEAVINEYQGKLAKILLEMDAHRPWVIKEPRLCLLFPFWKNLLEMPVCIFVYRNPVQIAQSLNKRNKFPIVFGLALWEKYIISAVEGLQDVPVIPVSYEGLMQDPVATTQQLYSSLSAAEVSNLILPSDKEIKTFIDESLYHHQPDDILYHQYLSVKQAEIDQLLKSQGYETIKNKFEVSEHSHEVLKIYEQALQQDIDLKNSISKLEQKEADLHKNNEKLKEKDDAIRKRDEKLKEKDDAIRKRDEKLKEKDDAIRKRDDDSKSLEKDHDQLFVWTSQLMQLHRAFFHTTRWKIAHFIIRVLEIVLLRGKRHPAIYRINAIGKEFENWRRTHNKKNFN